MIKAILFDNDGVLTDSPEMFSQKLIRERNLDENKVNLFFKDIFVPLCMTGKSDLRDELEIVLPLWGIDDSVESILKYWFESENCINNDIKNLIQDFKKKGIKCYLATNQEKYRTEFMIKEMGFGNLFDGIFSSASLGVKKPDSKFYEKVFSDICSDNMRPSEVLYIDDEEKNIFAGRKFGFTSFHYKNFKDLSSELIRLNLD